VVEMVHQPLYERARRFLTGVGATDHHCAMRDADFERLYAEYAPGLFAFLAYRTGDREGAEDLLGDTFERALCTRRRFDPRRGRAKTWLFSIALNLLRDDVRRRAAEGRALERARATAPPGGSSGETDPRLEGVEGTPGSERRGAGGGCPAVRRRSHRPRNRQGDRPAADDRRGACLSGPRETARCALVGAGGTTPNGDGSSGFSAR
jgi:RNA polymerase sigma factor (sigma-70 family)